MIGPSSNTTEPTKSGAVFGPPMSLAQLTRLQPTDTSVDETTGASWKARLDVASLPASNQMARLQVLRTHYPGAMLDENGDYTFLNPATGRWTKLNESQFTMKDVLSAIPEASEMAGQMVGGIAGAAAGGTPTLGMAALPGAVLGAGAGGVTGREFAGRTIRALTGTADPRPMEEQGTDALKSFGVNAAGELGGRGVMGLAKWGGRGIMDALHMTPDVAETAISEAGTRLGVEVPKLINTRSKVLGYIAARLRINPLTTQTVADAGAKFSEQASTAMRRIVPDIAGDQTVGKTAFNSRLAEASADWIAKYKGTLRTMDDAFQQLLPAGRRIPVPNTLNKLVDMEEVLLQSPEINQQLYGKAIEQLRRIGTDAAGAVESSAVPGAAGALDNAGNPILSGVTQTQTRAPGVPFDVLRNLRTEVGNEAFWESPLTRKTAEERALGGVYDALKRDLGLAAQKAGPEAEYAWKLQNRYIQMARSDKRLVNYDLFQQLAEKGGKDVSPAQWALSMEREGPNKIKGIFEHYTPADRQALRGAIFEDMGSVDQGGVQHWSLERFGEQWDKLKNVRNAILDGPEMRDVAGPIRDLVQIAKVAKMAEKSAAYQPSSIVAGFGSLTKWAAVPAAGIATSHPVLAGLAALSPFAAAQLLTNKSAVTLLRNAAQYGTWTASIGARMLAMKKENAYLSDSIDDLMAAGASVGWPEPTPDSSPKHNTGRQGVRYEPIN
jgi:hypothetical protein